MGIAITAGVTFVVLLILSAGLGFISVIAAFLIKKTVPRAHDTCAKCIAGWSSKRGLRNRLLLTPLFITLAIFIPFVVIGLTDTTRVRSRIEDSTLVIVRPGGNCHRRHEQECVLLRLETGDEIRALSKRISLGLSMPGAHCMCCGDMTFDFYRDDELHYSFSVHHGERIRIKGNSLGDKELSSASRRELNQWLDEKGVIKALEMAREQERQRREAEVEAMEKDAQSGRPD